MLGASKGTMSQQKGKGMDAAEEKAALLTP